MTKFGSRTESRTGSGDKARDARIKGGITGRDRRTEGVFRSGSMTTFGYGTETRTEGNVKSRVAMVGIEIAGRARRIVGGFRTNIIILFGKGAETWFRSPQSNSN